MTRTVHILFVFVLLTSGVARVIADGTRDEQFLQGLRARQLYRIAEQYVESELSASNLDERRRAMLVVEQGMTRIAMAIDAPPRERDIAWQRATEPLEEYLQTHTTGSLRLLVELQRALVDRARGEVLRHEARPGDAEATEAARTALRAAAKRLGHVATAAQLISRERVQGNAHAEPAPLRDDELRGIERGTVLQRARTQRQLGLSYPEGSADRDDGLLQSIGLLEPLATATVTDVVAWQAREEMLLSLADLGRATEGLAFVEKWTAEEKPYGGTWLAAVARLQLTSGDAERALATLGTMLPGRSPECDLVRLEIGLFSGADGQVIAKLLASIRANHSPVWARRAALLAGERLADENASDARSLEISAEHYFHARQLPRARDTFDKAVAAHVAAGNRDGAIHAAEQAAAVSVVMQDWPTAAARYRQLAFATPTNPNAPRWHRERLLAMASQIRDAPNDTAALADFRTACEEHLQHWPTGSIADEVRVWLARQYLAENRNGDALDLVAAIDPAGVYFEQATTIAASAFRREAAAQDADRTALAAQATQLFQPVIFGSENQWPTEWTTPQREAAVVLADLRLRLSPPDLDYARRLLTQALDGSPPPDEAWRNKAIPLLAIALSAGGDAESAIERLAMLGEAGVDDRATEQLLSALVDRMRDEPAESAFRKPLVTVIDSVISRLPTDTTIDLRRYRALVVAAQGDRAEAVSLYRTLVKEIPRDGDLHEELATLLGTGTDASDMQAAVTEWQRIEASSQRSGERWYRARLARVLLLNRLGQRAEAEKLVALTRVLQPELGERLVRDLRAE